MRIQLRYVAVAAVVIAGPALAGSSALGSTAKIDAKKPLRIAVFLGQLSNTYETAELKGVKQGAAKYGAAVTKVFNGQFSAATQLKQLQDAIATNAYDAFVIDPNDGGAITPQIKDAIKHHILVGCMLTPCGPDPTAAHNQIPGMVTSVGFPFNESGKMIAQLIVLACGSKNPCNVAYMPGLLTLPLEKARNTGLYAVLKKHKNIKVVAQQEGKYDTGTARSVMQNILTANPHIDVAASSYDGMTTGIEQAVKAAGLTGKIKLIGSGGSEQAIAAVRAGKWLGTVRAVPITEGQLVVKYLVAASQGKKVPGYINEYSVQPGGPLVTPQRAKKMAAEYRS
jgi:ribose transport system substrate-binding protein